MRKSTPKTLKTKNTKQILKLMFAAIMIVTVTLSFTVVAFANSNGAGGNSAESAVKELYNYIVSIVKVAGVLLALFGIIQIGVSISQTHDAAQRMSGILMLAGGALLFFGEDILSAVGISI